MSNQFRGKKLLVVGGNRAAAAGIYEKYKAPFLNTIAGAKTKALLVRDEDVQILHGFDSQDNAKLGTDVITQAAIEQLAQVFGPEAGQPHAILFKDWATDPLTATDDDRQANGHPVSGGLAPLPVEWRNRVWLSGSEAGRRDAGYLAGAIEAAEYVAMQIIDQLERKL